MKIIKYTLNSDGTIPEYIIDGGYLTKYNGNPSPQDHDLIGIATDNAPEVGYASEAELLQYVEESGFIFINPDTKEEIPLNNVISSIWSRLE